MKLKLLISNLTQGNRVDTETWHLFLERYTGLILRVIKRFETDYDRIMNRYLQVCKYLSDDDYKSLRKFAESDKPITDSSFPLWLAIIVRNSCIDFHRQEYGRPRLPKMISEMSLRDQQVYKLYFWKGYTPHEIEERVRPVDDTDERSGIEILKDLEEAFLSKSRTFPKQMQPVHLISVNESIPEISEDSTELDSNADWMNLAIAQLEPEHQLVFKLRFWEDVPPKEISLALGIDPPSKVYRILKKGLDHIKTYHKKSNQLNN